MATKRLSSSPITVTVTGPSTLAWPTPGQFANATAQNPRIIDSGRGPWNGSGNFGAIWEAWNGGVFAPTLGAYGSMLFFGGGHDAYFGNEVVRLDVATRTWSYHKVRTANIPDIRLTGDTDKANVYVNQYGEYPDGAPYPVHTNMGVAFLPPEAGGGTLGSFCFMGHDQSNVRITVKGHLWKLDLATLAWSRTALSLSPPIQSDLMALEYDSNRKGLWLYGHTNSTSGPLYFIDTVNGDATFAVYQTGGSTLECGTYPNLVYDPVRDVLLTVIRKGSEGTTANENIVVTSLTGWSPSSKSDRPFAIISTANGNVTGTPCPSLWGGQSKGDTWQRWMSCDKLEYCSHDGNFYGLNLYTSGPCSLYRLTPPASPLTGTWTWTNETLAAKNGEQLAIRALPYGETWDARLYGKMRFVPGIKSFVLSDSADKPAQALRPSNFV